MEQQIDASIMGKLRKLKALVDQGVDGEAIAAKLALEKMLAKHGLCYEDLFIENEPKKEYEFRYSSRQEKQLLIQCLANMFGSKSETWKSIVRWRDGSMRFFVDLTEVEYTLFKDFYEFHRTYWKEYIAKQTDLLMDAYIHAQNLWDCSPRTEEEKANRQPSKYSMAELIAVLGLSEDMRNKIPKYRKQLTT